MEVPRFNNSLLVSPTNGLNLITRFGPQKHHWDVQNILQNKPGPVQWSPTQSIGSSKPLTLSRTTSLFLISKTFDRYRHNSAFASPSDGGAAMATPTASDVTSVVETHS